METLLQAGANPNVLNGRYDTALRAAVVCQELSIVQMLLDSRADTELCKDDPSDGSSPDSVTIGTALYIAMRDRLPEIAHALIAAGADVNTTIPHQ